MGVIVGCMNMEMKSYESYGHNTDVDVVCMVFSLELVAQLIAQAMDSKCFCLVLAIRIMGLSLAHCLPCLILIATFIGVSFAHKIFYLTIMLWLTIVSLVYKLYFLGLTAMRLAVSQPYEVMFGIFSLSCYAKNVLFIIKGIKTSYDYLVCFKLLLNHFNSFPHASYTVPIP